MPFEEPLTVAAALAMGADVARWRGALDASDDMAYRALELLREVPRSDASDAVETRALESILSAENRRPEPDRDRVADRIVEVGARTGSDAARALALFVRWGSLDFADSVAETAPLAAAALDVASRATNRYAVVIGRYMAGAQAFQEGRIEEAAEHIEAAIAATGVTSPAQTPTNVPLVAGPTVAGIVAQLQGRDEDARTHVVDRLGAWMAERRLVDPMTEVDIAIAQGYVFAIGDDPEATLLSTGRVTAGDVPGWMANRILGCRLLAGWARTRLGHAGGVTEVLAAADELRAAPDRIMLTALLSFAGAALLHERDERALDVLERSRQEAESRGEVWWLPETLRLLAEADGILAGGSRRAGLLAEAAGLAARQGSTLLVARLAAVPQVEPGVTSPAS
jgi:hypothetical protein